MINSKIEDYTKSFTSEESEEVQRLLAVSDRELDYTDMICGRQVGALLKLLVSLSGAQRVLDIGTFSGYSALMMAEAMPENGELITCELNERYTEISEQFFTKPPFSTIIKQILGDALKIIPNLTGTFDLIFLDADKLNYPAYYRIIKEKIKPGSILVADNTLWNGEVLKPYTPKAKAIHTFNCMIKNDPYIRQVMLPVRDGLLIGRFV